MMGIVEGLTWQAELQNQMLADFNSIDKVTGTVTVIFWSVLWWLQFLSSYFFIITDIEMILM